MIIIQCFVLASLISCARSNFMQNDRIQVYDTEGSYSGFIPASVGISNTDIEQCRSESATQTKTQVQAKLLKFDKKPKIPVLHCSLKIEGSTLYCGTDGAYTYTYPGKPIEPQWMHITRDQCNQLVHGKQIAVNYVYGSLKGQLNITTRRRGVNTISKTVLGQRYNNGACIGGAMVDNNDQLYSRMIYDIKIEAMSRQIEAEYSPQSGLLTIPGEVHLTPMTSGVTSDRDLGQFFYNASHLPNDTCQQYKELWSGSAEIMKPKGTTEDIIIFRDPKGHIKVSLSMREKVQICNLTGFETQEEGISVLILNKSTIAPKFERATTLEYTREDRVNTRFSTLYFDLSLSLQKDFRTTLFQICEARKLLLLHHLSTISAGFNTAIIDPSNAPSGVETLVRGAMTYVLAGNPMTAKIREHRHCCNELAITLTLGNGTSINVFADPRTSVIKPYCTFRICDRSFPYVYQIRVINTTSSSISHKQVCTEDSPRLMECRNRPLNMDPAVPQVELEVDQMMQSQRVNPKITVPEAIKAHHMAILVDHAEETIIANTAFDFVGNNPVQLAKIVSDAENTPVYRTFTDKLVGSVASHISSIWESLLTLLGGLTTMALITIIIYRLCVCVLKRVTHSTLDIKKYGIQLGESRVFKNLSATQRGVELDVERIEQDRLRTDAKVDKAFELLDGLKERLSNQEARDPSINARYSHSQGIAGKK